MTEKEIVPDLFEIDENLEIEDNVIEDIRNSLRGSIDKSIDASVNESLRRSINHSYNQSMRNSLMSSINTEGQGILRRLKLAFEGSVNKEV
jgi:preprotein translocase subunit SecF